MSNSFCVGQLVLIEQPQSGINRANNKQACQLKVESPEPSVHYIVVEILALNGEKATITHFGGESEAIRSISCPFLYLDAIQYLHLFGYPSICLNVGYSVPVRLLQPWRTQLNSVHDIAEPPVLENISDIKAHILQISREHISFCFKNGDEWAVQAAVYDPRIIACGTSSAFLRYMCVHFLAM